MAPTTRPQAAVLRVLVFLCLTKRRALERRPTTKPQDPVISCSGTRRPGSARDALAEDESVEASLSHLEAMPKSASFDTCFI